MKLNILKFPVMPSGSLILLHSIANIDDYPLCGHQSAFSSILTRK